MIKFSLDSFSQPKAKAPKNYWWDHWSFSLSGVQKEAFYSELSLLLNAKIPLKEALQFMQNTQPKKQKETLYAPLLAALNEGDHFFEVLKKQKGFGAYEWNIVKIGEETGALNTVVASLSSYYKEKNMFRKNLSSAMVYPALLLLTASFVVVFMLTTIVPLFEHLFAQQNLRLPKATRGVIFLSNAIKDYGFFTFLGGVLIFFLGRKALARPAIRSLIQHFFLQLPYLQKILRNNYAYLFSQTLHLLIQTKVPLVKGLNLMEVLFNFIPLQNALAATAKELESGERFGVALEKTKFFDQRFYAFLHIGEATHQLDEIFAEMVVYYRAKIDQHSKRLSSLIEPLIIIVVGLFIGAILVAMYLPMFQLSTVLG